LMVLGHVLAEAGTLLLELWPQPFLL
jgi:hypothetical protein